jgi:hypothetical protein
MINYYVTTTIHLSLEPFYNEGLTSDEAKEIIEKIQDPFNMGWNRKFLCERQYVNGNWNVSVNYNDSEKIHYVVRLIECDLRSALNDKEKKKRSRKKKAKVPA